MPSARALAARAVSGRRSVAPAPSPMTNLDDRYRLLKCVALGGGIRTHNAQDTSTGRPVMVHILDGAESEAVERLRGQVGALPAADRSRILDVSPTDGGLVIVSEILSGLTSFQDWLDARVPAPTPAAKPPTAQQPAAPPVSSEPPEHPPAQPTESFVVGRVESSHSAPTKGVQVPGEFTQLFQPVEPPAPLAPPSAPKTATSPVAGPTAARPAAAPPISPPPSPKPPPAKPAPTPAAPPAALKPGEFTSLFRPVAAPPPQQMEASPLMGGPSRPSQPPSAAPLRPAAPPPTPFGGSSSSVFAAPPPPAAPPPAPPGPALGALGSPLGQPAPSMPLGAPSPTAPSPSASPLLGGTPLGASAGSNASLPQVIPPPVFSNPGAGAGGPGSPRSPLADQRAAGPSDYTMLIRQSATPPPPVAKPAAPAPAASPTEPRRSIPLGLIIALNVVLLLAIALVLYFVFRPAPPNVTPGGAAPAVPTAAPAVQAPAVPSAPAVKAPTIPNASKP